jgi:hypothetical protein
MKDLKITKGEFVDIPGYEGLYMVNKNAEVKSLPKKVRNRNGFRTIKENILRPAKSGKGYWYVCLHKNKKKRTFKINVLVAMAFLGHKPCGLKIVVDHIDNNKDNNCLENIQLITNRKNTSKDRVKGTSDYTGVYFDRGKWVSTIYANGRRIHLGRFLSEEDANFAYQEKLKAINNTKGE